MDPPEHRQQLDPPSSGSAAISRKERAPIPRPDVVQDVTLRTLADSQWRHRMTTVPAAIRWRMAAGVLLATLLASCGEPPVKPSPVSLARHVVFTSHRTGGWRIWAMRPDGSAQRALVPSFRGYLTRPSISPDGSTVAFVALGDIHTVRADGSDLRQITSGAAFEWLPIWSPDGSGIAFYSDRSGNGDVYFVEPDGTGLRQLTSSPETEYPGSWSADGSLLLFSREDPEYRWVIAMVDRNGTDRGIIPVPVGGYSPSLSPDGSQFVYQSSWNPELRIADISGANDRLLLTEGSNPDNPQWSPDGAWILYDAVLPWVYDHVTSREILLVRPDGSERRRLTEDPEMDFEARWGPVK